MAFNFFKWFAGKNSKPEQVHGTEFFSITTEPYVRELAFWSCVNLISNAVAKCEFKTFANGTEIKSDNWYRWNMSPNKNQSANEFISKLISKLMREGAALVVTSGEDLLVADDWQVQEYALYDNVFSNVTVGDWTFGKSFQQSDVLYFRWLPEDMRRVVDGLYQSYSKLIAYGMKGYQRSRGTKGTLTLDAQKAGDETYQQTYTGIVNDGFRTFAEAENALMPLWNGMKYDELSQKTYSSDTTRDIRSMIDDVTDFTARAFCIPPQLLNGSVQAVDSATEQFLTFCIDPLTDMLAAEINRKTFGKSVIAGNHIQIDTKCIKHVDLLSAASGIDKLVSSGVECINDIRTMLGQPIINEPWAWQHFITKNYADIQTVLEQLAEGG